MKKTFKKGLAAIIVASMMLGCVACGNNESAVIDEPDVQETTPDVEPEKEVVEETVEEEPEEESEYNVLKDADGNVYDLGGMEIIVADWWSGEPAEPTTAQEEATQAYRDFIQTTYNFKIKQFGIDGWGEHPETFTNFATTGGEENYVFVMRPDTLSGPLSSGLFYDLSTLDCLDFSEEKWNVTAKELMTKGSSIYGMRAEAPEPRGGIFFNKRLFTEAGVDPESIYDMQKDGKWTWDAFEEVCQALTKDVDNDGVTDTYAMTSFSDDYFHTVVASNNAMIIGLDDTGKYAIKATDDAFLEAMNWGMDMVKKYEMPSPEGAEWNYAYTSFKNAEAAMIVTEDYNKANYADMADDFGFVMFPYGPNATCNMTYVSDNIMVIPACYDADRAWKIAFAYNLYTEPTPGYEATDDWKSSYYTAYRDARAVDETLTLMRTDGHYSPVYWKLIPGIASGADIYWEAYSAQKSASELVEAKTAQWQSYLDEANK